MENSTVPTPREPHIGVMVSIDTFFAARLDVGSEISLLLGRPLSDCQGRFDYGRLPVSLAERLVGHLETVVGSLENIGNPNWDDKTLALMIGAVRDDQQRIDKQIAEQS
ncbi:hypothetical protein A5707_01565 [Mycobacterium kyorinense]|uniref:Uncharacterized protein n=1 Tax=Mycobacterium kyorinense TaxID=487514 RepID=A0A1A2Z5B0_9MYCO|nr:hypothetical protein A5707_01565 [Mycobacterium kyorinense]